MSAGAASWQGRMQSLLDAIQDVCPLDHPPAGSSGSPEHQILFDQYCRELKKAKKEGEKWFAALVQSEEERTGDHGLALANALKRRPVGAVSHPDVTGAVRHFWLRCDALNRALDAPRQVAPEEFVLKWLADRGQEKLAEFLTGYSFWPIGMDADGHWV